MRPHPVVICGALLSKPEWQLFSKAEALTCLESHRNAECDLTYNDVYIAAIKEVHIHLARRPLCSAKTQ